MKLRRVSIIFLLLGLAHVLRGGTEHTAVSTLTSPEEPARFDVSIESAYLLGIFGNPHSYEINADFLTARVRWGKFLDSPGFFRGYNQVYFSAIAEPIIRGVENHYFGMNLGVRYNFVRPGSRVVPYFSGGLGLGWIDSNPDQLGAQGQDFTFNILTAAGVSYKVTDRFSGQLGLLYQHLSNAGQSDPNPSLNLLGPQLAFTFAF